MNIVKYTKDQETVLFEEFKKRNTDEMSSSLWTNICLGIITLGIIFALAAAIVGMNSWSVIITIVTWLILIGSVMESYTIIVPAFQLWIATDYFREDGDKKLVPYRTGFHLKKPWQSVDQANKIDLKKEITIQSRDGWGCTSSNGILFETEFNISYRPSEEFSTQYLSYPEHVRDIKLRTAIEEILSTEYATKTAKEITDNQKAVKLWGSEIFGGDDTLSNLEKDLGIRVRGPTISAIRMNAKDQETKSTEYSNERFRETVEMLKATGLSAEDANRQAQILMKFTTRTEVVYDIKGVQNASSIWIGGGSGNGGASPIVNTTNEKNKKGGKS